jgi:hypothetical protein
MKSNLLILISICFFALNNMLIGQDQWEVFRPADQSFEILTPYPMKSGEKKLLTDVGEVHPKTWICEGKKEDDNYLYLIALIDYPDGTFHKDSVELVDELFKVSMDTHIQDLGGNLVYKADASLGFHKGLIYRASYNDNKLVAKCRLLLVGDRFYSLQVYTVSEKSLNDNISKFLNSFKVGHTKE